MSPSAKRLIHAVDACAVACSDGVKGYRAAAASARDTTVRSFLEAQVGLRERMEVELWATLAKLYPSSQPHDGSTSATLHRWFIAARALASGDRALLEECDRGEKLAQRLFEIARNEAVGSEGSTDALRKLLDAHYAAVCAARLEIEAQLKGIPATH